MVGRAGTLLHLQDKDPEEAHHHCPHSTGLESIVRSSGGKGERRASPVPNTRPGRQMLPQKVLR